MIFGEHELEMTNNESIEARLKKQTEKGIWAMAAESFVNFMLDQCIVKNSLINASTSSSGVFAWSAPPVPWLWLSNKTNRPFWQNIANEIGRHRDTTADSTSSVLRHV